MTLLTVLADKRLRERPRRGVQQRALSLAARREITMITAKREQWTERELRALTADEHDFIERKGGLFLSADRFSHDLEKAISAFANSGGGHLIIGIADDGTYEGVEPLKGTTRSREWLEQKIATCVTPPLTDYRVHEVIKDPAGSAIPQGRVVLVVDIGDSVLAPHQAEKQKIYFCRQSGRSERASHFYLEVVRSRIIGPKLRPELKTVKVVRRYAVQEGSFVECDLVFWVHNDGNLAAYKWALVLQTADGYRGKWEFDRNALPRAAKPKGGIPIGDDTILPSMAGSHGGFRVGFFLRGAPVTRPDMIREIRRIVEGVVVTYRAVSEVSRGESVSTALADALDVQEIADAVLAHQVEP